MKREPSESEPAEFGAPEPPRPPPGGGRGEEERERVRVIQQQTSLSAEEAAAALLVPAEVTMEEAEQPQLPPEASRGET